MKKFLRSLAAVLLTYQPLFSQNFAPDPTFGEQGVAKFSYASGNDSFRRMLRLANGSYLVAGHSLRATQDFCVARFNSNGSLDASYGQGGASYVDIEKIKDNLKAIALQPDGKLVGAGSVIGNAGSSKVALFRLLPNGSLDPDFGTGGKLSFVEPSNSANSFSLATDLAILSDGKILICGYYLQGNVYMAFIKKLLSNGQPDNAFGTNGSITVNFGTSTSSNYLERLAIAPSGKIYVFGLNYVNRFQLGIARYTATGVLDNTFSSDGLLIHSFTANGENYPTDIHVEANDDIVVSGYANSTTTNYRGYLAKFSADGNPVAGFGTSGQVMVATGTGFNGIYATLKASDGGFFLTGEAFSQNRNRATLFKVTAQGTLDTGFGNNGFTFISASVADGYGMALAQTANGVYVAGAQYDPALNSYQSMLFAAASNGQPQAGFGTNGLVFTQTTKPGTLPRKLVPLSNGKYLAAGDLDNFDTDQYIQSVSDLGVPDPSIGGLPFVKADFGSVDRFSDQISAGDGSLVQLASTGNVSRTFTGLGTFSNTPDYSLVRINPASGFVSNSLKKFRFSSSNFTTAVRLQADPQGRIVVLAYEATPTRRSAKISRHLASDLSLDPNFGTAGVYTLHSLNFPTQQNVPDFFIDSDGFYYVLETINTLPTGGSQVGFRFKKFNDSFEPVNSFGNGTFVEGTFELLGASGEGIFASRIVNVPNGFVLIGSKSQVPTLFRVNANGTGATEIPLNGFRSVGQVVPYGNGGLLVAGVNTSNRVVVVAVLPNGSIDPNFNGSGLLVDNALPGEATVRDLHVDAQGRIVVLAQVAQPNGDGDQCALLRFAQVTGTQEIVKTEFNSQLEVYPNPTSDRLFFRSAPIGSRVQVFNIQGQEIVSQLINNEQEGVNLEGLPAGTYHLQMTNGKSIQKATILKH